MSALLCLCLVLSLLPMAAHAQTLETYMALGDSITTGFGLADNEQSFAEQAAQAGGLALNDTFATDGLTSAELLEQLSEENVKAAVAGADFITITIDVTIPATYKITLASDPVDAAYCFVAGRQYDDCYYVTRGEEVTLEGFGYVDYVFDSWQDETGETLRETSEYSFKPVADTTLVMHCVPSVYELTAAPDDIDFGTKTVGYSTVAAQTVTVTNTGNDWLLLAQPEAENYVISQIDEEDRPTISVFVFSAQVTAR